MRAGDLNCLWCSVHRRDSRLVRATSSRARLLRRNGIGDLNTIAQVHAGVEEAHSFAITRGSPAQQSSIRKRTRSRRTAYAAL